MFNNELSVIIVYDLIDKIIKIKTRKQKRKKNSTKNF
jgi:hypothetical protein